MLTTEILSTKWHITTQFTNNKVDKYVLIAADLAKFVTRQRRVERRQRRKTEDKSPLRPMYPMDSWLIDLILKKCEDYIEYFRMKETKVMQISVKVIF